MVVTTLNYNLVTTLLHPCNKVVISVWVMQMRRLCKSYMILGKFVDLQNEPALEKLVIQVSIHLYFGVDDGTQVWEQDTSCITSPDSLPLIGQCGPDFPWDATCMGWDGQYGPDVDPMGCHTYHEALGWDEQYGPDVSWDATRIIRH